MNQNVAHEMLLVVLGMHCSGASTISRAMRVFGATHGDNLMQPMIGVNDKGFWEDIDIVQLNVDLMADLGLEWHSLRPLVASDLPALKSKGYFDKAKKLLEEKINLYPIFAFKDPRVSKCLLFWKEVFTESNVNTAYILTVRNPLSVANSLLRRDGISQGKSFYLWLDHVLSALSGSEGENRIVIDYDRLMTSTDKELTRLATKLNLSVNQTELVDYKTRFLDESLRHSQFSVEDVITNESIPTLLREVYSFMINVAQDKIDLQSENSRQQIAAWLQEHKANETLYSVIDDLSLKEISLNAELVIESVKSNELKNEIAVLTDIVEKRNTEVNALTKDIQDLTKVIQELNDDITSLLSSKSWRITKPLRYLKACFPIQRSNNKFSLHTKIDVKALNNLARQSKIAANYIQQGEFKELYERLKTYKKNRSLDENISTLCRLDKNKHWGILTTPHTLFIAHLIKNRLQALNWSVEVITTPPKNFDADWYIVICPQMFKNLPPAEKCVVFQLEQSVSSRWFTEEYLNTLETSLAVLDYNLININFLFGKAITYPHVYYLPIGAIKSYNKNPPNNKIYDVLFYGDSKSSVRRREMLTALKKHFNVHEANEIFGSKMQAIIQQSKIVINLHYYENALLEVPRIQECLSLGVPVISEAAQDQDNYPELHGAVRFFEEGSIAKMLEAVTAALQHPPTAEEINRSVSLSSQRFEFLFDRFLVGMDFLPTSHVLNMKLPLQNMDDIVVLSLPETIQRRRAFEAERTPNCVIFDGIRRNPGWVGCGLSYFTLAQHALANDKNILTVMEDDVILPSDFELKHVIVREYLELNKDKWDVFSGLIADLNPEVKIISVQYYKGIKFVTLDKMTSMVFNIYNKKTISMLATWNPDDRNVYNNTIDRYLEKQTDLRVVVTLPFLVGHREEVTSTIWGFKNTQYVDLIAQSEEKLRSIVEATEAAVK